MSRLKKALEKAKAARDRAEENSAPKVGPKPVPQVAVPAKPAAGLRQVVNPSYDHTQVVKIDPTTLRHNKIIANCIESGMADQIKLMRAQVLRLMKELQGNSLLVTSAKENEGKTLTAINLALSVSQELDRTVLLVDADLRNPSISDYLGLGASQGLSDYLKNRAEIPDLLISPGLRKLTILPAGRPLPNSSELLGGPKMESLVKEMKTRYTERFIIYDSPSLLTSADALVMSRFIDGIILVVESEKTHKKDLRRALELLRDRPIVGTILNKARG